MTPESPRCEECGVPFYISGGHSWLNDGSLVQASRHESRMAFIESEAWDPIWTGLGELIGLPVERFVITGSRNAIRVYIRELIPDEVMQGFEKGELEIGPVIEGILLIAGMMGYGGLSLEEVSYRRRDDDYAVIRYREPFSVPLAVSSVVGVTEALTAEEDTYEYDEISPGTYDVRVFPSAHPQELRKRLVYAPYKPSAGTIDLERCRTCGAPAALGEYEWDFERGTIKGRVTARRMCMIGPAMIDPVFQELEAELGEDIPRLVVEAQRRFVRTGPFRAEEITDKDEMRRQFALRGLGDLEDLHMGRRGVRLTLARAAFPLWVVGLVQGLYELVFGEGSAVEWELKDDGRLEIEISPALEQK